MKPRLTNQIGTMGAADAGPGIPMVQMSDWIGTDILDRHAYGMGNVIPLPQRLTEHRKLAVG